MAESTASDPSKGPFSLDDAYAVVTPQDSIRLYREWADSYEDDFVTGHHYVCHLRVVERFAAAARRSDGPVLDIGCGTGVVGWALSRQGSWAIDGLDISPDMLAVAHEKMNQAGEPVYGALIEADLTQPLDIASNIYGAVVSAGTFTIGHVGPAAVGELTRITRPGGLLVLGVNSLFFERRGFQAHLQSLVDEGAIGPFTASVVEMFEGAEGPHSDETAHLIVARVS